MATNVEASATVEVAQRTPEEWLDLARRAGMVGTSAFGVQYDLNPAWRETPAGTVGASFCDHNCTTELGNYTCLASTTLNVGVRPSTLVPAEVVLGSFGTLEAGIDAARTEFFDGPFQAYCAQFRIPTGLAEALRVSFDKPGFEVNLFGGNPELHPGITDIIGALRADGRPVHLTTTGGRFMRDQRYLAEILRNPPSLIALSADDFEGPEDIHALAALTPDELKAAWRRIPRLHGQRRKAHEAIYAAKLAQSTEGFPPILFNMVLHSGNLRQAQGIITALTEHFPDVRLNPFPAQSAFAYEDEPALAPEDAPLLRDFVDHMLEVQMASIRNGGSTLPYVPHVHYWLMLRAAFDWAGDNHATAVKMVTGDGIWRCYQDSPAGFYVQVGLGEDGKPRTAEGQHPGGCLGCFWNKQTVTDEQQIWDPAVTPNHVRGYIRSGKSERAAHAERPCPGCAFPRLVGHIISTEAGMSRAILPFYFARRKAALGF